MISNRGGTSLTRSPADELFVFDPIIICAYAREKLLVEWTEASELDP